MYVLYFYVVGCVCQPQINEHVMLCMYDSRRYTLLWLLMADRKLSRSLQLCLQPLPRSRWLILRDRYRCRLSDTSSFLWRALTVFLLSLVPWITRWSPLQHATNFTLLLLIIPNFIQNLANANRWIIYTLYHGLIAKPKLVEIEGYSVQ